MIFALVGRKLAPSWWHLRGAQEKLMIVTHEEPGQSKLIHNPAMDATQIYTIETRIWSSTRAPFRLGSTVLRSRSLNTLSMPAMFNVLVSRHMSNQCSCASNFPPPLPHSMQHHSSEIS